MSRKATWRIFVLFLLCPALMAQRTTGTIVGTVTDATGAVVPGAEITLTNLDTGASRSVLTSDTGAYALTSLPPGLYRLQATLPGFKEAVVENVRLNVDQQRRTDLQLELGEITEQVTVQAQSIALGTENPSMGEVISQEQLVELPLNGRGFVQLASLSAGMSIPVSSVTGWASGGRPSTISISGQRAYNTEFRFDGIPSKERVYGVVGMQFNVDAIQEFNVSRGYSSSEEGLSGRINVVTKSGSNEFHGTVYNFHRNAAVSARSFFSAELLPLVQNQYGVTAGGPIIKDKLFFFGEFEGLRVRQSLALNDNVPERQWLEGDFSNLLPETPIIDPLTGEQFPGNIIPSNRISNFSRTYNQFLPAPNQSGVNNWNGSNAIQRDDDKWSIRADYTMSDSDTFFGRLTWSDSASIQGGPIPEAGLFQPLDGRNAVLNWTHTFTPTLLQDMKVGWNRVFNVALGPNKPLELPDFRSLFNIQNTSGLPECNHIPRLTMTGFLALGTNTCIPLTTNDYHFIYNLSYNRGRHRIKVGSEITRTFLRQIAFLNSTAAFNFTPDFTHPVAAYVLGNPTTASGQNSDRIPDRRSWFQSYYIDDEIQFTPKLSVNLGLRYDNFGSWGSADGKVGTFDPFVPGGGYIYGQGCTFEGESCSQFGRILEEGGSGLRVRDDNNFAPRIGFAYSLSDNTVIRSSYGIFYQGLTGNELDFATSVAPFQTNIIADSLTGDLINIDQDNLFPAPEGVAARGPGITQRAWRWDGANAYLQNWTMSIQHTLPHDVFFEAAYVGSKGTHIDKRDDINLVNTPPPPGTLDSELQARRPFPDFSWLLETDMDGNMSYQGLQLTAKRSVGRGLTFLANYTWSKTMDTSRFGDHGRIYIQGHGDKARSVHEVRQRAVISFVYALPGGDLDSAAARALLGGWQMTGITSLQSGHPFNVLTATDYSRRLVLIGGRRPNRVCDGNLSTGQRTLTRWFDTSCFEAPASTLLGDPFDTLGDGGSNYLDRDGIINQDFGFYKNFAVTEQASLQFRAEFFNLFNHPNFGPPAATLEAGNFGTISSASLGRVIQFALKFRW